MTAEQQSITFAPQDPRVGRVEAVRLSRQTALILQRLRQGPATNAELGAISFRYGARIHDLRAAGYVITLYERDTATGVTRYRLDGGPA